MRLSVTRIKVVVQPKKILQFAVRFDGLINGMVYHMVSAVNLVTVISKCKVFLINCQEEWTIASVHASSLFICCQSHFLIAQEV